MKIYEKAAVPDCGFFYFIIEIAYNRFLLTIQHCLNEISHPKHPLARNSIPLMMFIKEL